MENPQIEIPLDDIVLRLDPEATRRRGSVICSIKAEIVFPSGEVKDIGYLRYAGKLIDPLLQDHVLKQYETLDDDKYLKLDSDGRSLDPNYQKWINYRCIVGKRIQEFIQEGKLKIKPN